MAFESAARRLAEHLHGQIGDGLRGVVSYTLTDAEPVYLRDDLQGRINLSDLEPTINQARSLHEQLTTVGELQGRTLGNPLGNVSVFEESIVMVFLYDSERGVVATLEQDVGRDLSTFVEQCSSVLTEAA